MLPLGAAGTLNAHCPRDTRELCSQPSKWFGGLHLSWGILAHKCVSYVAPKRRPRRDAEQVDLTHLIDIHACPYVRPPYIPPRGSDDKYFVAQA